MPYRGILSVAVFDCDLTQQKCVLRQKDWILPSWIMKVWLCECLRVEIQQWLKKKADWRRRVWIFNRPTRSSEVSLSFWFLRQRWNRDLFDTKTDAHFKELSSRPRRWWGGGESTSHLCRPCRRETLLSPSRCALLSLCCWRRSASETSDQTVHLDEKRKCKVL